MSIRKEKRWSSLFNRWFTTFIDSEPKPMRLTEESRRYLDETKEIREYQMSLIPKISVNNPK